MRLTSSTLALACCLLLPLAVSPPGESVDRTFAAVDSLPAWASSLVGTWSCEGAFGSGKPLAADIRISSVLGSRWLAYHHKDRAPGRYEAFGHWGPVAPPPTALATTVLYDNFGGARRFQLTFTEGGLTLDRDTTVAGAIVERFVFKPREAGRLWFAWEVYRDNRWILGDSLGCRQSTP